MKKFLKYTMIAIGCYFVFISIVAHVTNEDIRNSWSRIGTSIGIIVAKLPIVVTLREMVK